MCYVANDKRENGSVPNDKAKMLKIVTIGHVVINK